MHDTSLYIRVCVRVRVRDNPPHHPLPQPQFSARGAYAPDAVYQPEDVAAMVAYAYDRGCVAMRGRRTLAHAKSCARGLCAPSCCNSNAARRPPSTAHGRACARGV